MIRPWLRLRPADLRRVFVARRDSRRSGGTRSLGDLAAHDIRSGATLQSVGMSPEIDETELALFRTLVEGSVAYYVGGLFAAALHGIDVSPRGIDLFVADRRMLESAALAAGVTRDSLASTRSDRSLRIHEYPHRARFEQQHALAKELHLRGVLVRTQGLEGIEDDIEYYCGQPDAIAFRSALAAGGAWTSGVSTPETDLGTFIGESLQAALEALGAAGYAISRSRRAGTYSTYYDDVDPRTGTSSAGICVYEDPARPVLDAIRRGVAG
jgi:hypothetical protein